VWQHFHSIIHKLSTLFQTFEAVTKRKKLKKENEQAKKGDSSSLKNVRAGGQK